MKFGGFAGLCFALGAGGALVLTAPKIGFDPSTGIKSSDSVAFDPVLDSKVDKGDPASVKRHIAYLKSLEKPGHKGESRAEWYEGYYAWMLGRLDANGRYSPEYLRAAVAHRDQMKDTPRSLSPGGVASHLGPTNTSDLSYSLYGGVGPLSGRKNDIAIFPGNANTIYTASAGGGIWKTQNGGINWTALSDSWATLLTSSVAVHPTNPNLVLAGTGDNEGFFEHYGNGIMRSTNGGADWAVVGTNEMRLSAVNKIMFDPVDPTVVLAITSNGTSQSGAIYRSTNSGATWAPVAGLATAMYWTDIDRTVNGVYLASGVKADGSTKGVLYKSTNAGATWTAVTNPSTANNPEIDIACSKAVNNVMYMLSIGDERIYKSVNAGTSWTNIKGNFVNGTVDEPNTNWNQKDYDYHITVGKNGTQDVVYVGLLTTQMDVGGDGTWIDIGRGFTPDPPNHQHVDQHSGAMQPSNGNIMFFGCDGGLFKFQLTNPATGAGTWTSLNAQLKDHQLYHLSVHPTDATRVLVGMQDNACAGSRGNWAAWTGLWAGDGCWSAFDKANPNIHYTGSQEGSVFRHPTATTIEPTDISPGIAGEFAFVAPMVTGGPAGSNVFMAGKNLWRWSGAGTTWTQTNMVTGADNQATELAVAPTNGNVIYSGNPDGQIFRTPDGGNTFTQIEDLNIDRAIGALAVSWTNPNDVVVGLLGGAGANHLYRCTNTAAANPVWTNISGTGLTGLPPVPVSAVAIDPYNGNTIYVGTDVGGFMSVNNGATWTRLSGLGLPNVAMTHMQVNPQKTFLYVATFGRGAWRIPLANAVTYSVTGNIKEGETNVEGATVNLQVYRETVGAFTANPNAAIPDNNPTGLTLTLPVTTARVMTRVGLYLNITHPFRGNLQIDLVAPSGTERRVYSTSADGTDNYVGLIEVPGFENHNSGGTWTLKVKDLAGGNVGTVVQWKVQPYYMAYGTAQAAKVTDANGNYTFTGLPAGKYLVLPSETGRTFTPTSLLFGLGPNATGKNFQRNP